MRSPQDLLGLPYTFTQRLLLTPQQFLKEAQNRGWAQPASVDELRAFHRLRLLVPLFRAQRDGRRVAALARQRSPQARIVAEWTPNGRSGLREALDRSALFDPMEERFRSKAALSRRAFDVEYEASQYLYSHHQLLVVGVLSHARPYLRRRHLDGRDARLDVNAWWLELTRTRLDWLRSLVVPLSALEPIYYPEVVGQIRFFPQEYERFLGWRQRLRVGSTLRWLGVNAAWLRDAGSRLLREAERMNPLGEWHKLVGEADPAKWELLRGDARGAMDRRIAAEMLLRYHDELAEAGRAPKLERSKRHRAHDLFDSRLRSRKPLDPLLTTFGLSPHPSLVLVVEGATEMLLVPRLMEHFGIRADSEFIAVEDREGVAKDLNPLIAYAAAPRLEPEEEGRYLHLLRPMPRILVVSDAEGPMKTPADREKRRQLWSERLLRALPPAQQTEAVRKTLLDLVTIETWDRGGLDFEFAHFTDLELAKAITAIDRRDHLSVAACREHVAKLRAERGNLKKMIEPWDPRSSWPKPSGRCSEPR